MLSSVQRDQWLARMDRYRPATRLSLAPVPRCTQPLKSPAHLQGRPVSPQENGQDDEIRYPLAGVRLL